jgi:ABC-type Fe3+/spermidine/putrescine transport system ATPase subunit
MNRGRIIQRGTPEALYERPATHFVADFLGRSNFIEGELVGSESGVALYRAGGLTLRQAAPAADLSSGERVLVALRPEKVRFAADGSEPGANRLGGKIRNWTYLGADFHVVVATTLGELHVRLPTAQSTVRPSEGLPVTLSWPPDASVMLRDDRPQR